MSGDWLCRSRAGLDERIKSVRMALMEKGDDIYRWRRWETETSSDVQDLGK